MLTRNLKFTQIDDAPFVDVVDVALGENLTKKEHGLTTTRTHARTAGGRGYGNRKLEERERERGAHTLPSCFSFRKRPTVGPSFKHLKLVVISLLR